MELTRKQELLELPDAATRLRAELALLRREVRLLDDGSMPPIPAGDLGPRDVVRPLGLDRFGFRLRIERPAGRCDLRVPFPRPLTCPGQLQAATRQLICGARASRG